MMRDKLTDLCGNWLLPKDIIKTLYEMRLARTLVKLRLGHARADMESMSGLISQNAFINKL